MPIPKRRLKTTYAVGNGEVVLRIRIGEGQLGSSVVELGDREVAAGGVAMLLLGNGADLQGERLVIKTTVTDVLLRTDRTRVTYDLSGGPADESHMLERNAEENGGSVLYLVTVDFT